MVFVQPFSQQKWQFLERLHVLEIILRIFGRFQRISVWCVRNKRQKSARKPNVGRTTPWFQIVADIFGKKPRRAGMRGRAFPGLGKMESPIISILNGFSFSIKSHLAFSLLIIRLPTNPVTNMRRVFTANQNRTWVCGIRRRCRSYLFCYLFFVQTVQIFFPTGGHAKTLRLIRYAYSAEESHVLTK